MTADIKLKGKDGTETTYTGVDTIRVPTADGGNANFLLEGTGGETTETEEVNVEPDFSGGNQVVVPDAGKSFSKVTITKPAELLPGNVVSGVTIAGVVGTADSIVNFRTKLFTQYGAGGVVLVQPGLKVIRVYGTYVGGVFPMDSGLKADLGMLKDVKNVAAELHDVLNALGRFIGLARETFNAIFSAGEAVRIGNVVCGVPSVSGTLAGWNAFADILYGTLSNVSDDFTSADFVPSAAKELSGSLYQTDYWQAKFPFEWEAVKKTGEKTLAGYHFADISGKTMPIYDSGMYVQSGESGNMVGAVNANESLGVAADFVAMTGTWGPFESEGAPFYVVIVWYSYGSQTIPEAVLKQINSNWSAGDVALEKGWNITQSYQQDDKWVYVTGGSEALAPGILNVNLGILKKETVPYDNLDDYLKGMFTEVYDQSYEVVDKFLLEFNLTHESET